MEAIKEGRRIYDNIRKFVLFLLRANFDEILLIMATLLCSLPLPYLPIHILWINLMTDGFPALALGLEEAEPDVMERPPRPADEHILDGEWGRLWIAVIFGFLASFTLFYWQIEILQVPLAEARSVTLTMAIVFELFLAFNVRSTKPIHQIGLFSNKYLLAAVCFPIAMQFVLLYTPLAGVFHLVPLRLDQWILVISIAFASVLFFEGLKMVPKRK